MKLLILSTSIFYLLGLKLVANIEKTSVIQHKTEVIEMKVIEEKKVISAQPASEISKKGNITSPGKDSTCVSSVNNKNPKQVTGI